MRQGGVIGGNARSIGKESEGIKKRGKQQQVTGKNRTDTREVDKKRVKREQKRKDENRG